MAREAVRALERELVTSTQRAAGESGAVRGGLRGGFSRVASEKEKDFCLAASDMAISRGNFALFLIATPLARSRAGKSARRGERAPFEGGMVRSDADRGRVAVAGVRTGVSSRHRRVEQGQVARENASGELDPD